LILLSLAPCEGEDGKRKQENMRERYRVGETLCKRLGLSQAGNLWPGQCLHQPQGLSIYFSSLRFLFFSFSTFPVRFAILQPSDAQCRLCVKVKTRKQAIGSSAFRAFCSMNALVRACQMVVVDGGLDAGRTNWWPKRLHCCNTLKGNKEMGLGIWEQPKVGPSQAAIAT
jgi:hypothetical protein